MTISEIKHRQHKNVIPKRMDTNDVIHRIGLEAHIRSECREGKDKQSTAILQSWENRLEIGDAEDTGYCGTQCQKGGRYAKKDFRSLHRGSLESEVGCKWIKWNFMGQAKNTHGPVNWILLQGHKGLQLLTSYNKRHIEYPEQ